MISSDAIQVARAIFKAQGGLLRSSRAIRLGIQRRTLYAMRDAGIIAEVTRGWYRLSDLPALSNPDLAAVALRVPRGVICLLSALSFHELTTEIPPAVCIALEKGAETPRIGLPKLQVFRFSGTSFLEGIDNYKISGVKVRIYSPEKTIADCFKFRNKTGLDTALEALRLYRQKMTVKTDKLLFFARICRVDKIMRPYLESIL